MPKHTPKDHGLTREYLRKLYMMDSAGCLWHRRRPISMFGHCRNPLQACNMWNAKWAGREVNPNAGKYKATTVPLPGGGTVKKYVHHIVDCLRTGVWPTEMLDHANRDKHDNSESNLRPATASRQIINQGIRSDNTSGVTGVDWDRRCQKWRANIKPEGMPRVSLYYGGNFKAAVAARRAGELKYFGEYLRK